MTRSASLNSSTRAGGRASRPSISESHINSRCPKALQGNWRDGKGIHDADWKDVCDPCLHGLSSIWIKLPSNSQCRPSIPMQRGALRPSTFSCQEMLPRLVSSMSASCNGHRQGGQTVWQDCQARASYFYEGGWMGFPRERVVQSANDDSLVWSLPLSTEWWIMSNKMARNCTSCCFWLLQSPHDERSCPVHPQAHGVEVMHIPGSCTYLCQPVDVDIATALSSRGWVSSGRNGLRQRAISTIR